MLEIPLAYGSHTANLSSEWEQKCSIQERKRALWKKAGDLAQVMLRAYLECESLYKSLPELLRISKEKQLENIAYGSQQPEFRLLKEHHIENREIAFPEKLPRGLLNDVQAQAQILESLTRATQDTNGTPIHRSTMIGALQSAINSWKIGKSDDAIGINENRQSTSPVSNV
jgi:hypothetical protein